LATKRRKSDDGAEYKMPEVPTGDGYIPDATYGGVVLGTWVEGEVETGFLGAIKLKGKTRRTITTYRCNSCGYLDLMPQSNGLSR